MNKPELLVMGALPARDLDALDAHFRCHRLWEAPDGDALLRERGGGLRAVATKGELGASAALMDALPALEVISCYGVGVDAIDLPAARSRGVRVTNTPGVLTEEVADMAWALLLAAARRITLGDAHVRSGGWAARGAMPLTTRVWGRRLGIVGMGAIGQAVARRAAGFGMSVAYSGRARKPDLPHAYHPTPASLAAASDILVVCAAGGAETRGLVDRAAIEALPPGGLLVNVSRGTVVDEAALLDALRAGRISAGLDVFLGEPDVDPALAALGNVVLQPHNASGTRETRAAMGDLMLENLLAHFAGRPLLTPVA